MRTTGDGTASPMKRKAKSRYLNVKPPPKVFGMVEEMTATGDDMTKRTKTAIVIRGIKLVAKFGTPTARDHMLEGLKRPNFIDIAASQKIIRSRSRF